MVGGKDFQKKMTIKTRPVAKVLDGKLCAALIRARLQNEISLMKRKPKLVVIIVGDNPASKIYVRNKAKYAAEVGIESEVVALPEDVSEKKLLSVIKKLNKNKKVNGILVQLPLPKHIDEFTVINAIASEKDVDGFTIENKGLLSIGRPRLLPCTPLGIITLLRYYKVGIKGKNVVVIGRSNIVGKPVAQLFTMLDATVTLCHSQTKNLAEVASGADILVSAVGKPNLVKGSFIKLGAVVVDVAMNRNADNTGWVGDAVRRDVEKKASYFTPVPGGVGPMTIAMLLQNTLAAYKIQQGDEQSVENFLMEREG